MYRWGKLDFDVDFDVTSDFSMTALDVGEAIVFERQMNSSIAPSFTVTDVTDYRCGLHDIQKSKHAAEWHYFTEFASGVVFCDVCAAVAKGRQPIGPVSPMSTASAASPVPHATPVRTSPATPTQMSITPSQDLPVAASSNAAMNPTAAMPMPSSSSSTLRSPAKSPSMTTQEAIRIVPNLPSIYCSLNPICVGKASHNTSNLNQHLSTHIVQHTYVKSLKLQEKEGEEHRSSNVEASNMPPPKSKPIRTRNQALESSIAWFVLSCNSTFHVVESQAFRKMIDDASNSRFLPMTKRYLLNDVITMLVIKVQSYLKEELSNATAVALTTDMWSSVAYESYICLTVHWCAKAEKACVLRHALLKVVRSKITQCGISWRAS